MSTKVLLKSLSYNKFIEQHPNTVEFLVIDNARVKVTPFQVSISNAQIREVSFTHSLDKVCVKRSGILNPTLLTFLKKITNNTYGFLSSKENIDKLSIKSVKYCESGTPQLYHLCVDRTDNICIEANVFELSSSCPDIETAIDTFAVTKYQMGLIKYFEIEEAIKYMKEAFEIYKTISDQRHSAKETFEVYEAMENISRKNK